MTTPQMIALVVMIVAIIIALLIATIFCIIEIVKIDRLKKNCSHICFLCKFKDICDWTENKKLK